MSRELRVAVALHDVEPRAAARCRDVRVWLGERGVRRVTLLAIPAPRDCPLRRSGSFASWLRERQSRGDEVAQHGFRHLRTGGAGMIRGWIADRQGGDAAEFVGLDRDSTVGALDGGREILRDAGIEVQGFVAPAYAYTDPLRRELPGRYEWWADLLGVHSPAGPRFATALCLGTSTAFKRASSPALVRGLARLAGSLLRVDVHPADFDHRRCRIALERALAAGRRDAVTYGELAVH
jgi:predicted deacetylase